MFRPRNEGLGTLAMPPTPVKDGLRNRTSSMAVAAATVTMASWMPRMRTAGKLTRVPTTVVMAIARIGLSGNGMSICPAKRASMNAAKPAKVSSASVTWPT